MPPRRCRSGCIATGPRADRLICDITIGVTQRPAVIGTEAVGSPPTELDAATREQFTLYRAIARSNPALLSGQ
jgi:hypothetical protein